MKVIDKLHSLGEMFPKSDLAQSMAALESDMSLTMLDVRKNATRSSRQIWHPQKNAHLRHRDESAARWPVFGEIENLRHRDVLELQPCHSKILPVDRNLHGVIPAFNDGVAHMIRVAVR